MSTAMRHQILLVLLSVIASIEFVTIVMVFDTHAIYEDNHAMEHAQLSLLAVSTWLFARITWPNTTLHTKAMRWSMIVMAALSASFILREASTKHWGYDWLTFFTDGKGFKILMAPLWLFLLIKLIPFWRTYWQVIVQRIKTPTALYLMASALALIAGGVFDKEIFKPELFRFYEEILEFWGYVFLLLAAMNAHRDLAPNSLNNLR